MPGSPNIIRKQTLQFQYNGNTDGFALQKEVSNWCNFTLIPEIEQQLEVFSLSDDYISIDKLEIDATVDSDDWKLKIKDELIFELKQKLNNYKSESSESSDAAEGKIAKLDELIIYYLKTGRLPWWGKAFLDSGLNSVLHNWASEQFSEKRSKYVRSEFEQILNKKVAERLVNQLSEKVFFQFIQEIYSETAEKIQQFGIFFQNVIQKNLSVDEKRRITKPILVQLLENLVISKGKIEPEKLVKVIYTELETIQVSPKILRLQRVKELEPSNRFVAVWNTIVESELKKQNLKSQTRKTKVQKQKQAEQEQKRTKAEEKLRAEQQIKKLLKPKTDGDESEETEAELQEGIYIDNAGVVILAAFIPTLFEKLKLTDKEKIIRPDLALLIIQYAVSGKTIVEEHELVLPKILCGLDIDSPVDTNIEITEEQMAEVNSMLQSLIDYWEALKDTSVDGLREAFLLRNGKLSQVNNEWLLLVEQKAFDVLIERIPWSISMIKLPWMESLLKTEWV